MATRTTLLFAIALALPLPALAQQTADDAAFEQGRALRAQHHDAEALDVFHRLFASSHQPRAQAQVGLAEGALGQWVAAESDLAGALATSGDPWIVQNRAMLESAIATIRTHVGDLEVQCNAPHCEVWIGDQLVGALPATRPLRVSSGTVHFEVRAQGYETETRVATVPPGGLARENVALTTAAAQHASAAPAGHEAGSAPAGAVQAQSGGSIRPTLGIVGVIAGVVLVGVGVVFYVLGAGEASAYNNDLNCPGTAAASQGNCQGHIDSASLDGGLAIAGFVAGGVLAVAGVALIAMGGGGSSHASDQHHASRGGVRCGGGPGLVGVSCGLQF